MGLLMKRNSLNRSRFLRRFGLTLGALTMVSSGLVATVGLQGASAAPTRHVLASSLTHGTRAQSASHSTGRSAGFTCFDHCYAVTVSLDEYNATRTIDDSYQIHAHSNDGSATFSYFASNGNCTVNASGWVYFNDAYSCNVDVYATSHGWWYYGSAGTTEVFTINKRWQGIWMNTYGTQVYSTTLSNNFYPLSNIGAVTNSYDVNNSRPIGGTLPTTTTYFTVDGGMSNHPNCTIHDNKIFFTERGICTIDVNSGETLHWYAAAQNRFTLSISPTTTWMNMPKNISFGGQTSLIFYGNENTASFGGVVTDSDAAGYPLGTVNVYSDSTLLCTSPLVHYIGVQSYFYCSPTSTRLDPGTYTHVHATYMPSYPSSIDGLWWHYTSTSVDQTLIVSPVTVTYYGNGGGCNAVTQTFTWGVAQVLSPTCGRGGFTFRGWALSPTGRVVYTNQQSVTLKSSQNLYAVWG